ncbi:MAG: tetratricopeptide 2 repeat protein [Marmoricola sp.]|nr:tetratricopeptide 2 repeat protein [Marmoricola sp.]
MADDWFRSPDWSTDAQADFEARLRRAHAGNRSQYTRIKGIALRESGRIDAARGLWSQILDNELGHESEQATTLELMADSYVGQDPTTAERLYRRLLQEHPTLNGTTTTAEISLAELLIEKADSASMNEALALLNSFLERKTAQFPNVLFRWHLALVRIAQATGEKETVRRAAKTALDLAGRGPGFSRHKTVGIVHADAVTLKRLRKLAK